MDPPWAMPIAPTFRWTGPEYVLNIFKSVFPEEAGVNDEVRSHLILLYIADGCLEEP